MSEPAYQYQPAETLSILREREELDAKVRAAWEQSDKQSDEAYQDTLKHRNLQELGKIVVQAQGRLPEWMVQAACRDVPPRLFFVPGYEIKDEKLEREAKAKRVCGSCLVHQECLTFALLNNEQYGIWGGLNEAERKKL